MQKAFKANTIHETRTEVGTAGSQAYERAPLPVTPPGAYSHAVSPSSPDRHGNRHAWRDLAPAAALLLVGLIGLLWASLPTSSANGQYVVIAPPWWSLSETITLASSADAGFLEVGRFSNVVIAASDNPGFVAAARSAGALFVFASPRLAGCLRSQSRVRTP